VAYNQTVLPILELIQQEINRAVNAQNVLKEQSDAAQIEKLGLDDEPNVRLYYNDPNNKTLLTNVELIYPNNNCQVLISLGYDRFVLLSVSTTMLLNGEVIASYMTRLTYDEFNKLVAVDIDTTETIADDIEIDLPEA
jgi:hypothetical protein